MNKDMIEEVLVHHKKETRLQSIGMLLGIVIGVFIAMNLIDVVKSVKDIVVTQELILNEHESIKKMEAYYIEHSTQIDEDILVMWHEINGMKSILLNIESQLDALKSSHHNAE